MKRSKNYGVRNSSSPDLNLLDLFLWRDLQTMVYETPPHDISERRKVEECVLITPETF